MSRVYFHSPSGSAEVYGSERVWLANLVHDFAVGFLAPTRYRDRLEALLPPGHRLKDPHQDDTHWGWLYAGHLRFSPNGTMMYQGVPMGGFALVLNTALALGNPWVKLAAQIHGACEVHARIEGPHRAWVANLIDGGLEAGVFRRSLTTDTAPPETFSLGWDDVTELLRARDDEPVVMGYSVTGGFPACTYWQTPLEDWEREVAWEDLGHDERWRVALEGLRADPGSMSIGPDEPVDRRFEHTLSALDIRADDWEQRARKALGMDEP